METKGEIQNIKSNRKSLCILGNWYNSFNLLPEELEKGDEVNIVFNEKKVNDVTFRNIKKITKEPSNKEVIEVIKNLPKNKISDTTINCILMQSVQYSQDRSISLEQSTNEVIKSYKTIIDSI